MINKQEVLELTQKFYNNKGIYLNNDGVIGIDTKETIHITKNKIFFCYEDIVYKECNNMIELKDYYKCLTMEDLKKYLIEEKGFECYDNEIIKNTEHGFVICVKDNILYIGIFACKNKTPIQIYNIINNLMD